MGKSAKAPDYTAAAEAQGQSSKEVTNMQTWANRPDQITPWGSTTWAPTATIDPATGQQVTQWTQNTTLTPEAQEALNSQFAIQNFRSGLAEEMTPRVQGEFGSPMDWSQYGSFAQGPQGQQLQFGLGEDAQQIDPSQRYYDQAGDALMQQFNSRMDPQFQRAEEQLDTTLRNRGLKPGDQAYDQALADLRQSQGDQRNQAMYQATQLAGDEASRMYGMDMSTRQQQLGELGFGNTAQQQQYGLDTQGANYQNTLHQAQLAEAMQQRGFSLNEINALLSGQQVSMPTMPGFQSANAAQPTNYMGAAQNQYSAAQDAANAGNMFTNTLLSGLTGLGSSWLGG